MVMTSPARTRLVRKGIVHGMVDEGKEEDFSALFEQSLRTVKAGEVVRGHVVQVTRDYVTVDIGYKSEGQIPIAEFIGPDGQPEVATGDEIDVYVDSSDSENGTISLSRSRAEQLKVWTD